MAIQGPNATKILQPLTDMDIMNLKYYTFVKGKFAGVDNVLISATGYTGAGGWKFILKIKMMHADKIWDAIFEAGAPEGIKPIGLGARDTFGWKWVIVFMEMILTIPLHHWKQDWDGSPNLPKIL